MKNKSKTAQKKYSISLLKYVFGFMLFSLSLLTITSCQKDIDEAVGTWILTDWSLSGCTDSGDNFSLSFGPDGCVSGGNTSLCSTVRQVFNEDGTYVVSGSITKNGEELIAADSRGTWSRNGMIFETCDSSGDCNLGIDVSIVGDRATVTSPLNGCLSTQRYERN